MIINSPTVRDSGTDQDLEKSQDQTEWPVDISVSEIFLQMEKVRGNFFGEYSSFSKFFISFFELFFVSLKNNWTLEIAEQD